MAPAESRIWATLVADRVIFSRAAHVPVPATSLADHWKGGVLHLQPVIAFGLRLTSAAGRAICAQPAVLEPGLGGECRSRELSPTAPGAAAGFDRFRSPGRIHYATRGR